ncbi:MAG: hypothetical protein ICV70_03495 [Jiangellaceae bacterium]|nr:hypothetical protein [Jiangellaceae bacterium]
MVLTTEEVPVATLWCPDCRDDREFEAVPDGRDIGWACTGCGAAVLMGDVVLPADDELAAVA